MGTNRGRLCKEGRQTAESEKKTDKFSPPEAWLERGDRCYVRIYGRVGYGVRLKKLVF